MLTPPWERKRKVVILREEEPGPWGKRPEEREVRELLEMGIINLDKPPGPTSHEVSAWVKRILGARKTGHAGTLDPKVTGVLPVAVNRGTKVLMALLNAGKEYVGVMRLHGDVGEGELKRVVGEFVGEIYQRPPVKSSVKRRLRVRKVYYFEILEVDGRDVLFRVGTEAGTYIRKLCHDMGIALGVGAHMVELRRTRVGMFTEEESVRLQDVVDAYVFWKEEGDEEEMKGVLLPVERAVDHLPKVYVANSAVEAICSGAQLAVPGVVAIEEGIEKGDMVALMTVKGELVALARAEMGTEEVVESERGIVTRTLRVIMERGTYPKTWGGKGEKDL